MGIIIFCPSKETGQFHENMDMTMKIQIYSVQFGGLVSQSRQSIFYNGISHVMVLLAGDIIWLTKYTAK